MTLPIELQQENYTSLYRLDRKQEFITAENINELVGKEEIGLLNIDIDGMDYWVWKALKAKPAIVVAEYNSWFGLRPITVPYDPHFVKASGKYMSIYCGASLQALCDLAEEKGYAFVGCSRQGINAYFVCKDKLGKLPVETPQSGFVMAPTREHRDKDGKRYFVDPSDAAERFLKGAPVFNTRIGKIEKF